LTKKLQGKFYTPIFIVDKILDEVGYNSENILQKKILDPACGDGRFLIQTVKRIIKYSSKKDLKKNLSYVYGWDIDEVALKKAKENLDKLVYPLKIEWNLFLKNSLKTQNNLFEKHKFDFIVANPPYIRIQNLDISQREFIQKNYNLCKKGSIDIFIAFFELAFDLLKENGIAGFITPNSYFSTQAAKLLREEFLKKQNIIKIINYNSIQLFEDATTYSAITIFDMKKRDTFIYQYAKNLKEFNTYNIEFNNLKNKPFWDFMENKNNQGIKLKEIANINVGLQTLADKVYISKFVKEENNFIYLNTFYKGVVKFEKELLRKIIKVSKYNGEINEYIIFPYKKTDTKIEIIPENELKNNYPLTYDYLLSLKEILLKRDKGKKSYPAWYAFGRSQGLETTFGKKIIFSPMAKKPNFMLVEYEDVTFYSGYSIKSDKIELKNLLSLLNSKQMEKFITNSSRDLRNGWKAYNKKIVQEFVLEYNLLA